MRAAEHRLHLFACRACRCREEVQAASHHWAAEAVSLSARRGKQLFLQVVCFSASIHPTGHHAAVSLQCNSRAPHCTRGSLSFVLFAGPWPAVSIGRLPVFSPNFCMLLRGAVE
ncbi:hypothetical protein TcCL_ESM00830 [Trypanosoma cruzi]|nr:hypothetical protein TcCL_ESM00830 [Trypanosoma cruzi]